MIFELYTIIAIAALFFILGYRFQNRLNRHVTQVLVKAIELIKATYAFEKNNRDIVRENERIKKELQHISADYLRLQQKYYNLKIDTTDRVTL